MIDILYCLDVLFLTHNTLLVVGLWVDGLLLGERNSNIMSELLTGMARRMTMMMAMIIITGHSFAA